MQRSAPPTGGGLAERPLETPGSPLAGKISDTLRVRFHGRQEAIRERERLIGSHLPAGVLVLRIGRIGERDRELLAHDVQLATLDANRRDGSASTGQTSAAASRSRPIGGRCCWVSRRDSWVRREQRDRPGCRRSAHSPSRAPDRLQARRS